MRAAEYAYFDAPFLAFAHRGGATYAPNLHRENSLHAFSEAVALGYRYLETDVHATADGVLLAFHDDVLDRVTDRAGAIGELPYAEVAEARIHGIDPIPRLAELFDGLPRRPVQHRRQVRAVGRPAGRHDRRARGVRPGLRQLVRRRSAAPAPPPAGPPGRLLGQPARASPLNRFLPWLTRVAEHARPRRCRSRSGHAHRSAARCRS